MTDQLPDDWCAYHCRSEPGPAWLICGECWHNYSSPDELVNAWLALGITLGVPTSEPVDPDQIRFCPHCSHDF